MGAVLCIVGLHPLDPDAIPPAVVTPKPSTGIASHTRGPASGRCVGCCFRVRHLHGIISHATSETAFLSGISGAAFGVCGRQLGESAQCSAVSAVRTVCEHHSLWRTVTSLSAETCLLVSAVLPALCF